MRFLKNYEKNQFAIRIGKTLKLTHFLKKNGVTQLYYIPNFFYILF